MRSLYPWINEPWNGNLFTKSVKTTATPPKKRKIDLSRCIGRGVLGHHWRSNQSILVNTKKNWLAIALNFVEKSKFNQILVHFCCVVIFQDENWWKTIKKSSQKSDKEDENDNEKLLVIIISSLKWALLFAIWQSWKPHEKHSCYLVTTGKWEIWNTQNFDEEISHKISNDDAACCQFIHN